MILYDILDNLDKSSENQHYIPFDDLSYELHIFGFNLKQNRNHELKSYFIYKLAKNDKIIGFLAYFLNNEFVFLSNQYCDKSPLKFMWNSKEAKEKVRNYLLSLIEKKYNSGMKLELRTVQLHHKIRHRQVSNQDELLNDHVIYKNENYKIKKIFENNDGKPDLLLSKDGVEFLTLSSDTFIPFNIKKIKDSYET